MRLGHLSKARSELSDISLKFKTLIPKHILSTLSMLSSNEYLVSTYSVPSTALRAYHTVLNINHQNKNDPFSNLSEMF
jgi:hypothetical protein